MNSDELGAKGEAYFESLCADAQLICNRATRDRTGWDFFIEFQFASTDKWLPRDRRPQPPECRAQVKTVWSGSKSVKLRLSSAERLAKAPQPACIFFLVVDDALNFREIYAIHIIDAPLESILREVRKIETSDSLQVNKRYIRINFISNGAKITVDGASLRNFIEAAAGDDSVAYVRKKDDQRRNLGVIGYRYSLKFNLLAKGNDELADVMLGLRKASFLNFAATETRWGIDLPAHHGATEGEILVIPNSHDGSVTFRSKSTGEVIKHRVRVTAAAFLSNGKPTIAKIRIFNEILDIRLGRGDLAFSFQAVNLNESPLLLSQHKALNRTYRILSQGDGVVELRDNKRRLLVCGYHANMPEDVIKEIPFCESVLAKHAAGVTDLLLSAKAINEYMGTIDFFYNMLKEPDSIEIRPIKILPTKEFPADLVEAEALVISRIVLEDSALAICCIATVRISEVSDFKEFRLSRLKAREVRLIGTSESSFDEFEDDMRAETGLDMLLKFGAASAEPG